jgi:hypothetical protein
MNKLTLLALALLAFGSGCVHREIVGFNDHETKPLTALQVNVKRSYVFSSSQEFVFYSCAEQGDKLTCKRLCGGSNDVVCPEVSTSGNGATTNIR